MAKTETIDFFKVQRIEFGCETTHLNIKVDTRSSGRFFRLFLTSRNTVKVTGFYSSKEVCDRLQFPKMNIIPLANKNY